MYIYLTTSYDKEDNPDFIADFTLFILWSAIEANVAMIVCCMPTFTPALGKFRDGFASHLPSTAISKWRLLSTRASSKVSKNENLTTDLYPLERRSYNEIP